MNLTLQDERRFWKKVEQGPNCWTWKGSFYPEGYGQFWVNSQGRSVGAHRVSYQIQFKDLKPKLFVCHSCDNKKCVNPKHLWLGTWRDNIDDMLNKNRNAKGSKSGTAKIEEPDVSLIRGLYERQWLKPDDIAKTFNLDKSTIFDIINKKTWRHV